MRTHGLHGDDTIRQREKETSVTALFVPWEYIPFVSCLIDIMSNLNKEERTIKSDGKITFT